ncbi:MAG: hypothetical protein NT027_17560 [Proteobacteria bacterium]|nr:hypothetical protein [Pseudomonadota bacterium]
MISKKKALNLNLKNLSPEFVVKRFITLVIVLRIVCGLIHCFFPITMPHQWRQVDTMSVALRYFLRWSGESEFQVPWWATAVLNSQGTSGVMPMEFPFLNWVGAVGFWLADTDLDRGRIYASLLVFLINLILLRLAFREWRRCLGGFHKSYIPWAIVAGYFLSFSTPYSSKFMPDPMAMLLATWGTAAIGRLKWWGILPFALGLAMKPTVGVVCLLLILTPLSLARLRYMAVSIVAAIAPGAWWYKIMVPKIKLLQMQDDLFVIPTNFNPMTSLLEFWFALLSQALFY